MKLFFCIGSVFDVKDKTKKKLQISTEKNYFCIYKCFEDTNMAFFYRNNVIQAVKRKVFSEKK